MLSQRDSPRETVVEMLDWVRFLGRERVRFEVSVVYVKEGGHTDGVDAL